MINKIIIILQIALVALLLIVILISLCSIIKNQEKLIGIVEEPIEIIK